MNCLKVKAIVYAIVSIIAIVLIFTFVDDNIEWYNEKTPIQQIGIIFLYMNLCIGIWFIIFTIVDFIIKRFIK